MQIAGASEQQIDERRRRNPPLPRSGTARKAPGPRLRTEALRRLRAFQSHGTTTIEAKSGYGLDESGEFKTLRLLDSLRAEEWDIVPTFLGAQAVPPEFAQRAGDYLDWIITTLLPNIARRGLAQFADISCHRGAFTFEQARHYLAPPARRGLEPQAARQHRRHRRRDERRQRRSPAGCNRSGRRASLPGATPWPRHFPERIS